MNILRKVFVILMLGFASISISASSNNQLTGSFWIGGKTIIDPPNNEPIDTHLRVYLTGASAKRLFQAMKVKPVRDVCLDDGSLSKFIGGTQCTLHQGGKQFSCSFAINIESQRIELSSVC